MASEVIERTFPVSGKADLKLSNISGSVTLQPGADGQIEVKAIKHDGSGNASRTQIEMSQADDGRVTVATRFQDGILGFLAFSSPCDVDYEVRLPRACTVQVSGVSCPVEALGLQGDLQFSTVSGKLDLQSLSGTVNASTVSGDLEGQEIHGELHLKSVSGDMRLNGVVAGSVEASTVSGDIRLQAELTGGPYAFHSVSGNVRLELPAGAPCRAEHHSVSGSLKAALPDARRVDRAGAHTVEIGSGGPLITSHSISGDLTIRRPGEDVQGRPGENPSSTAHEAPGSQPDPKGFSSQERLAVLERIARGEITVEEGLQTLNSR